MHRRTKYTIKHLNNWLHAAYSILNLIVAKLPNKFYTFYGTPRFIAMFTRACP
jgi:hypothetical protein